MVSTYVCEVCMKNFKTNQHLNQHKNKKKKCVPPPPPIPQMHSEFMGISGPPPSSTTTLPSTTSTFPIPVPASPSSITNLMDLIFAYKTSLDNNKTLETRLLHYENKISDYEMKIDYLLADNKTLMYENQSLTRKIKTMQECVNLIDIDNTANTRPADTRPVKSFFEKGDKTNACISTLPLTEDSSPL